MVTTYPSDTLQVLKVQLLHSWYILPPSPLCLGSINVPVLEGNVLTLLLFHPLGL